MRINILIGNNFLIVEEKIKEISDKFKVIYAERSKNLIAEIEKYLNADLFTNKSDLVIKNLEETKENTLKDLAFLLQRNYNLKIILVFRKNPENFINLLKKRGLKFNVLNLGELKPKKKSEFIYDFLSKSKIKLPLEIKEFIIENYRENIDLLIQDLKKIEALGNIDQNTAKDLPNLITLQINVFKIQDYFLEKKWPFFIHHFKKFILEDKSKNRIESLKVLSLLYRSLIKIFLVKKNFKVEGNSYYINKIRTYSFRLSDEEIKRMIRALSETDKKFKKFLISIKDIPEDISFNYLSYSQS